MSWVNNNNNIDLIIFLLLIKDTKEILVEEGRDGRGYRDDIDGRGYKDDRW